MTNFLNNKGKPLSKTTYPFLIYFAALWEIEVKMSLDLGHFDQAYFSIDIGFNYHFSLQGGWIYDLIILWTYIPANDKSSPFSYPGYTI